MTDRDNIRKYFIPGEDTDIDFDRSKMSDLDNFLSGSIAAAQEAKKKQGMDPLVVGTSVNPDKDGKAPISQSKTTNPSGIAGSPTKVSRKSKSKKQNIPTSSRITRSMARDRSQKSNSQAHSHSVSVNQTSQGDPTTNQVKETTEVTSNATQSMLVAWLGLPRNVAEFGDSQVMIFKENAIHERLPGIDPYLLANLGQSKLHTTYSDEEYTAGEGLILRCVSDYYSNLPFIGHSFRTLEAVHFLARSETQPDAKASETITADVDWLKSLKLTPLASIVGSLIFSGVALMSEDLDGMYTKRQQLELIEEIMVGDGDVKNCFSYLGHAIELKPMHMPDFPGFLYFTELIVNFVNSVAKGDKPKDHISVNFSVKYPGEPCSSVIEMGPTIQEEETKQIHKRKRDDHIKGGKHNEKKKSVVVAEAAKNNAFLITPPYVDPTGTSISNLEIPKVRDISNKPPPGRPSKKSKPPGNYVTKEEFSSFVSKQETYNSMNQSKMSSLEKKAEQILEKIGSFNENLCDTIARLSFSDLVQRVADNAGKMDTDDKQVRSQLKEESVQIAEEMKTMIKADVPHGASKVSSSKQQLIDKLKKKSISATEAEHLIPIIQSYLIGTPRESMGTTITVGRLQTIGYRDRLISILRETPELIKKSKEEESVEGQGQSETSATK